MLGRFEGTARQRMKLLGIIVPPEIIEKFKKESYFSKGDVPLNKGRKQIEYMSAAAIKKTKKTRFKKGQLPHNTKQDLQITIRPDKRGVKYQFIRVSLNNWVPLHRYNWEKDHGKIAPKMKLIFKDGDTMNCDIGNLELITNADLMKRNSYHNYGKEIASTIQLRGVITRQINKHIKILQNEK